MRLIVASLCVALSCSCASRLKPVYVVPDAVAVEGDGVEYPNASARNVVTFSSGLPMVGRELTLTCPDGHSEMVSLTNDSLDPIGLVSTVVLAALTASNVASAVRSEFLGDQVYYGALATLTGGAAAITLLTNWQPSRPVTVNHPGSVCTPAAPPTPTPTPEGVDLSPATIESPVVPPAG